MGIVKKLSMEKEIVMETLHCAYEPAIGKSPSCSPCTSAAFFS